MKTKLLTIAISLGSLGAISQTTYNLDWFAGIGSNADLTILQGDTVIWTWTSSNHTVENVPGSSVETFNSGFLGPTGSIYSYTFTVIGANDYFCGVHGAASMSGTITVEENLGIGDETMPLFMIESNPATNKLLIRLPQHVQSGTVSIFDLLGKQIKMQSFQQISTLEIEISNLNRGLYLVNIESEGQSETKRFIKN